MTLPQFSVQKPVTILMLAAGIILLGIISWTRLPQELFPPITYPQITVVTTYENAAPEEIEALITRAIEESVSAASNIRKVSSTSREGTSIVICEFAWNTNMDFAALNVREKVDLIKEKLPRDAEEPIVMKYNPFDTPIMMLSVTSPGNFLSAYELREISRRIIKDEIEKIDGVAQVVLTGGREREVLVELNQERLRAFNVSILDVIELLKQANLNYPAGTIETSFYEYLVRTMGEFKTVADMYEMPLLIKERADDEEEQQQQRASETQEQKERKKRVIYLRELGEVKDTLKDKASISRYNGENNISLSVQRQADSNTLAVNKKIYTSLETLRHTLPAEVTLKVVYDQSVFIEKSINELRNNALQGGALAFLILLIFLKNIRSAIVVTVGIPISILFTLILMFFGKLSLNMMSLGGLALGVGMLVDNGIVVIENIFRHRQQGKDTKLAAQEASDEVFSAIIGSTLTTVAVFLPLVFVVGIAGQLFKELALTVTFSLIASVITAMSLTPMFMSRGKSKKTKVISDQERIRALKKKGLGKLSRRRGPLPYFIVLAIIGVTLLIAAGSFKLLLSLDREFMPKLDQRQFIIKLNMPAGTNLKTTDSVVTQIENIILGFSVVKDATVNIGSSKESKVAGAVEVLGANQANIIINLKTLAKTGILAWGNQDVGNKNNISTSEFIQRLKDKLDYVNLKEAELEYILQESIFKSVFAGSAPLVVVLKGFDLENILIPATKEIEKQLGKIEGVYGIKDSLSPPSPEVKVRIRKDRASLYQLTVNKVASVAQAAVRGYVATKFKEEGREIDVRVRLRKEDRESFNKISKLFIFSPLGMNVFLEQLAYLTKGKGPTEIKREGKQRVVFVSANIYNRALNDVVSDTQTIIKSIKDELPQNYTIELGGENKEMEQSFRSLQFALILALVLVYMIMASEFESLVQPFIIMFCVPLSLIGVSWALFMSKTPLSVVVVLGFIMLGGIVVNNGILLIDFINLARKQGLGIFEAAIHSARVRARPILMTSLTTIFGLLPLAFAVGEGAELRAPMAMTVMGGLTSAAFLTLFVVPCVYIILETLKEKIAEFFAVAKREKTIFIGKHHKLIQEIDISSSAEEEVIDEQKKQEPVPPILEQKEIKEVIGESSPQPPPAAKSDKHLTQRQIEALDYIKINRKISRLEYVVKFKVPLPIADRELEGLVERGILKSSGEGPHKVYTMIIKKED